LKNKLFSITKKDLEIQTFRAGGKGGQNQNKVESGVRIIHYASGARGEARDSRDQLTNKRAAFERMVNSPLFKRWIRIEIARHTGALDEAVRQANMFVDEQMDPKKLKVEYYKSNETERSVELSGK
jgi:protein subunit release factor B